MLSDVCRLCLTKDNLVWIFDKRFENSENMKDVIHITTGVEITIKDIVSQKICKKCCEVTIKMFEFRRTSLANDRHLREQSLLNMKDSVKIPHTEVTIRSDKGSANVANVKKEQTQETAVFKVHPTVRELFKVYPQIKLPTVCLKSHITPFVSLPMDQVENYFKVRKLDINEYTRLALRSGKVATKKTASPATSKASYMASNNFKIASVVSHESTYKQKVPPIKIIQSKPQSESKIVNKVDDKSVKTNSSTCENLTLEKTQQDKTQQDKKRKIDEVETTPKKENFKKPAFIESLGLTPKVCTYSSITTSESPAYVANMSVPLHICEMCNSVQYSAKDLKRHQYKHLRCQFCKMRFRTLDSKERHIENTCVIKQTMNNLPDVVLDKIEHNVKIRKKYPEAFVYFPPLKDTVSLDSEESSMNLSSEPNRASSNLKDYKLEQQSSKSNQAFNAVNPVIIEILSDDEEPSPPVGGTNKENIISNNVLQNSVIPVSESNANKDNVDTLQSSVTKPIAPMAIATEENIIYNTVSIVKPDIRIRGNCIIDNLDPKLSDTKLLKELLSNKPLHLSDEKNIQTDLPANESICINRNDSTIELKQLKQQLHVYKIPVVIKFGALNVSYNYQTELKQPRKLCLWNDLMPIDIKTNKIVLNNANPVAPEPHVNKTNVVQSTCSVPPPIVVAPVPSGNNQPKGPIIAPNTSLPTVYSLPSPNVTSPNITSPNIPSPIITSPVITSPNIISPSITSPNITSPKYIRINKSSLINSTNIIELNPLLNKFLHTTSTSTTTSTVTTTICPSNSTPAPPSTSSDTPISSSSAAIGTIRVKNVWELT